MACDIPVNRYALDNWPPESYRIQVIHQGDTAPDLAPLQVMLAGMHINAVLAPVSLDDLPGGAMEASKEAAQPGAPPMLAFGLPGSPPQLPPLLSGPANEATLKSWADSPLSRDMVSHLAHGDAAVWILLQCGRNEADTRALETLRASLKVCGGEASGPVQQYAVLTLSRTAPEERALVKQLLESEPDLADYDAPLAFPIFGRGRVLYALVDEGITTKNIGKACAYVTGPCSCQVKDQNPGMDLLLAADWERIAKGLGASPPPQGTVPRPVPAIESPGWSPVTVVAGALGMALVLVLGATAVTIRRAKLAR